MYKNVQITIYTITHITHPNTGKPCPLNYKILPAPASLKTSESHTYAVVEYDGMVNLTCLEIL